MNTVLPSPDVYVDAGHAFSERHKSCVTSIDESKLKCRRGDRRKANVSDSALPSSTVSRAPNEALTRYTYTTNAVTLSRHQCRFKSVANTSPERRQISPLGRQSRRHKVVGTQPARRHSRTSDVEQGRRPNDRHRGQFRIHRVDEKYFEDARISEESPTEEFQHCSSLANVHNAGIPTSTKSTARRILNTRCRDNSVCWEIRRFSVRRLHYLRFPAKTKKTAS